MRVETISIICAGDKIIVEKETLRLATRIIKKIEKSEKKEINLQNISKKLLLKIIEYCDHYKYHNPKKILKPLRSADLRENGIDKWDIDFVDFNNLQELSDLIVVANIFEVEDLVNLGCAKFASLIKHQGMEVFQCLED